LNDNGLSRVEFCVSKKRIWVTSPKVCVQGVSNKSIHSYIDWICIESELNFRGDGVVGWTESEEKKVGKIGVSSVGESALDKGVLGGWVDVGGREKVADDVVALEDIAVIVAYGDSKRLWVVVVSFGDYGRIISGDVRMITAGVGTVDGKHGKLVYEFVGGRVLKGYHASIFVEFGREDRDETKWEKTRSVIAKVCNGPEITWDENLGGGAGNYAKTMNKVGVLNVIAREDAKGIDGDGEIYRWRECEDKTFGGGVSKLGCHGESVEVLEYSGSSVDWDFIGSEQTNVAVKSELHITCVAV
jgi:hypothetical protein